jgi:hypothetical protein
MGIDCENHARFTADVFHSCANNPSRAGSLDIKALVISHVGHSRRLILSIVFMRASTSEVQTRISVWRVFAP